MKKKKKVAIVSLTACEGCQVALIDLGKRFFDFLKKVELVDFHLLEEKPFPKGKIDIVFVEGNPITKEDVKILKSVRKQAKLLAVMGNCAALGGIPEMKNYMGKKKTIRYVYQGLKRQETDIGLPGDIIAIAGIKEAEIGDTISNPQYPDSVLSIKLEEPTLSLTIGPNTSPLMGKEGKFVTGRQILERIQRELQTNIAMRFKIAENGKYTLFGRGELHLSVFLETLRREGYEIEVSKPTVITKIIDREEMEPIDELTCDVDNQYIGAVKSEIGKRRGILLSQDELSSGTTRMTFQITTRGLLGLRGTLLTLTRGTAVISSIFIKYDKIGSKIQRLRKGVIVASNAGKAATYGLVPAHDKGPVFIKPQTIVYEGMIVGINARDEDVEINVCKEKQLTNNRSVGEEGIVLPPSLQLSLEQQLSFLEDDELLEITPQNLRLRKKILDTNLRRRQVKRDKN